jgi:hypothetical protein
MNAFIPPRINTTKPIEGIVSDIVDSFGEVGRRINVLEQSKKVFDGFFDVSIKASEISTALAKTNGHTEKMPDATGNNADHDSRYLPRKDYLNKPQKISGPSTILNISHATSDTDKFIVSDSGELKYRTGAETLSDIGAAAAGHNHDHTTLTNLNSATHTHLTAANHTDLTDGGETTLHKHSLLRATKRIVFADSPYTILTADECVFANTDGGAIAINLPAGVSGKNYVIAACGTSGNALTITPNGAETLFGAAAATIIYPGEVADISFQTAEGWR